MPKNYNTTEEYREKNRIRMRDAYRNNVNGWRDKFKKYRADRVEYYKEKGIKWRKELRREIIFFYSKGKMECRCCKENIYEFLVVDHIQNNGAEERKKLKIKAGSAFYLYLRKSNFPKGYQVLCHNCNAAKEYHGVCPHKRKK